MYFGGDSKEVRHCSGWSIDLRDLGELRFPLDIIVATVVGVKDPVGVSRSTGGRDLEEWRSIDIGCSVNCCCKVEVLAFFITVEMTANL